MVATQLRPACWGRYWLVPRASAQIFTAPAASSAWELSRGCRLGSTCFHFVTIEFALLRASGARGWARLASSSLSVGIATTLAVITLASQQPTKGVLSISVPSRSALARRGCLSRLRLRSNAWDNVGIDAACPEPRASQKPSLPASEATAMRSILRPAFRLPGAIDASFTMHLVRLRLLHGWRSTPGTITGQRASSTGFISMTRSACRPVSRWGRDRLKIVHFAWSRSIGSTSRRMNAISSAPPLASFSLGSAPPDFSLSHTEARLAPPAYMPIPACAVSGHISQAIP